MKKRITAVFLLLLALALALTLAACDGGETTDPDKEPTDGEQEYEEGPLSEHERHAMTVTYAIEWDNELGKQSYAVTPDSYGEFNYAFDQNTFRYLNFTGVTKNFHLFKGVYTAPNGNGDRAFDTAGNFLLDKIENGTVFYAYWEPATVIVCYNLIYENMAIFPGGAEMKTVSLKYGDDLPAVFPEVLCENSELLYWRTSDVSVQVSDYNMLLNDQKTVAQHCKTKFYPTSETENFYVLNFYPVLNKDNCYLTLDYGDGRVVSHELKYGASIAEYLVTEDFDGKELVGWAYSKYETSEFVTKGTITQNITLHAIWKPYRVLRFHSLDGVKEARVYQNEMHYLTSPEPRESYTFDGWYSTADYDTYASRVITYDGTVTDYFARWFENERSFTVQWYEVAGSRPKTQSYTVTPDGDGNFVHSFAVQDYQRSGFTFLGIYTAKTGGTMVFDKNGVQQVASVASGTYYARYQYNLITVQVQNGSDKQYYDVSINAAGNFVTTLDVPLYLRGEYEVLEGFYTAQTGGTKVFDGNGTQLVDTLTNWQILYPRYTYAEITFVYLLPENCSFADGSLAKEYTCHYGDRVATLEAVTARDGVLTGWKNLATPEAAEGKVVSNGTTAKSSYVTESAYTIVKNTATNRFEIYLLAVIESSEE